MSQRELEQFIRKRLFLALALAFLVQAVAYAGIAFFTGEPGSLLGIAGITSTLATLAVLYLAWKTREYLWPLRILSLVMVGWMSIQMLRQGQTLPAAGWWLSVVPFVLAAADLRYLAVAALADFVGLVLWLHFGPGRPPFGLSSDPVVEDARRVIAVIGSELLALALIKVAMRSRAEMSRALERARLEATGVATLKARFLAHMSHEIRTPLTGILGAAEILDSARLTEAQRKQLVSLQQQSARTLLALVNDALDFAKLEAGKIQLESRPLSMRGVVFEANELFATQAFGKGIELSSSCTPDVPQSFIGDGVRLGQIVANLAGNAVKFTERGGVHIHLCVDPIDSTREHDESRRWVRVEVTDSGPGIPAGQLQTLFDAFSQADSSISRRFGGTGLGLSISSELATLMGGRIEARSVVGHGSSFSLVVPLKVGLEPTESGLSDALRRRDVLVCVANKGLERHLKSLFREMHVEPDYVDGLPREDELKRVDCLIIDEPLLRHPEARSWISARVERVRRIFLMTPAGVDPRVGLSSEIKSLYKPVRRHALEEVLAAPSSLTHPKSGGPEPERRPLAGLRVLVAEDNTVNQIVVQAMLEDLGATSAVASHGDEALARATEELFDVILMDLNMPVRNGVQTTRALRAKEREPGCRRTTVFAMSASCDSADTRACLEAGMDGYLLKPFNLLQLRRRLEPCCSGAEQSLALET